MVKKKKNWNPTCNRFVAFLDIMGFRDIVFRNSHQEVKRLLESLRPTIKEIEDYAKEYLKEKRIKIPIEKRYYRIPSVIFPVTFSDSIILISADDSLDSALDLFDTVRFMINGAFNKGLAIKGAVACGEMTAILDKSLYFGKPLIDAYDLQKEVQLYGVVLHHTMEKHIVQMKMIDILTDDHIFKWLVPLKSGRVTHYIVDWIYLDEDKKSYQNAVNKLYDNVSGTPRLYVDNTIDFLNCISKTRVKARKKRREEVENIMEKIFENDV